jgi:DNA-binding CsgD family transcriptional regulator
MGRVFVGRSDSLAELRRALADRRPLVVLGEVGVGKTTLVREAVAGDRRRVFEGGALGMLGWREYLALERALGRPVNGVDPAAVAADVQAAVRDGVLVLEDLHWAAPATLQVLEALAGRIALVVTVRAGDPGAAAVLETLGAAGFGELELAPLDPEAAAALARDARPGLGAESVASLVRRSGGNPLLLTELGAGGSASAGLRRSVAARLRDLDPPAREVFLLLSLAGSPLREDVLTPAGAKALRAVGLVVESEPGYLEPRHSLLGEIASDELPEAERVEAFAVLARLVDRPGEAARHHAAAGEREMAHQKALQAADAAATPGERAGHLRLAASTADGQGADELRLAAGRALAEGYDWDGVETVLAGIDRPEVGPEIRAEAWLLRARGAWARGKADEMEPALEAGLAACAGLDCDIEILLRIESSRVPIWVRWEAASQIPVAAGNVALAIERGVGVARAQYFHGTALAMTGKQEGLVVLAEAVEAASRSGDFDTEFVAANNLISFHESDGDPAIGREFAVRMRDRAHDLGLGMWETNMRYQIAQLDFHAGRCQDALRETEDLLRLPVDARTRDAAREVHCMALVDLGRIEEADRLATPWMADGIDDQQGAGQQFLWVRAEAALASGRPAEAVQLMDAFLTGPEGDPNLIFGWVTRAWGRLGIAADPGEPPPDPGRLMIDGAVPEVAGVGHLFAGRHMEAAERFVAAAELWRPYHYRGWLRCGWARGEALRLAGEPDAAIPALREVEASAEERGFGTQAARARHSLRQAGERRAASRGVAVGGLTAREAQVLALAAEGLTNTQIADRLSVSVRTVLTQIDSASARLGATSRIQAAAMYRSLAGRVR